jgi:DNA polymerase III, epsilon subunit and related 3''-5'' exonucleases
MVEVDHHTSEVVRLCAVDFLTGSILIDTYVMPTVCITDYRTRFSGVTPTLLSKMALEHRVLNHWAAARAELYKHIDDSTILIGQSLNHDLDVLRMIHFNIIDTAIVTCMAVDKECKRRWGLKTLCGQLLGRVVQNEKTGHDCLEDVFATREVLWWCLMFPDRLAVWAELKREELKREEMRREEMRREEMRREEEKRKKEKEKKKKEKEKEGEGNKN